jgi:hypothetical protein
LVVIAGLCNGSTGYVAAWGTAGEVRYTATSRNGPRREVGYKTETIEGL